MYFNFITFYIIPVILLEELVESLWKIVPTLFLKASTMFINLQLAVFIIATLHVFVIESFQILGNRKQIGLVKSQYLSQTRTVLYANDDSATPDTPIADAKVSKVEVSPTPIPSNISKPVVQVSTPVTIKKKTVATKVVVSDEDIQLKYATLIGK